MGLHFTCQTNMVASNPIWALTKAILWTSPFPSSLQATQSSALLVGVGAELVSAVTLKYSVCSMVFPTKEQDTADICVYLVASDVLQGSRSFKNLEKHPCLGILALRVFQWLRRSIKKFQIFFAIWIFLWSCKKPARLLPQFVLKKWNYLTRELCIFLSAATRGRNLFLRSHGF